MSVIKSQKSQGLIARVIGIFTRPQAEWDVIAPEAATTQSLMFGYAAILAALPAIAQAHPRPDAGTAYSASATPSNRRVRDQRARWPTTSSPWSAFSSSGLIIDGLAPSFGGEKNPVQALKVAVYSWTAAWLAGDLRHPPAGSAASSASSVSTASTCSTRAFRS